ncbi:hypothetical protein SBA3_2410006 [Candidatus Sulfopaludibacter sp. SbA3]|nr:hypothetical protein SBA3_2410006 [Candidatus Sulfopaludibacter sp. SbA3]
MTDKQNERTRNWGEIVMDVNRINGAAAMPATAPVSDFARTDINPALAQAVTAVNGAKLFGQDSELTFAMDRETKHMVVRLVDKNTRHVIRQIPPQSILQLAEDLMTE